MSRDGPEEFEHVILGEELVGHRRQQQSRCSGPLGIVRVREDLRVRSAPIPMITWPCNRGRLASAPSFRSHCRSGLVAPSRRSDEDNLRLERRRLRPQGGGNLRPFASEVSH
jgi:hypothetical protein